MYHFCFNFILFGHTGHANFGFNWCSAFTESYFQLWKRYDWSKSLFLRFPLPGKKIPPAKFLIPYCYLENLDHPVERKREIELTMQLLLPFVLKKYREMLQKYINAGNFYFIQSNISKMYPSFLTHSMFPIQNPRRPFSCSTKQNSKEETLLFMMIRCIARWYSFSRCD